MRGVTATVLYLISVIVIAMLVVSFLNYGRLTPFTPLGDPLALLGKRSAPPCWRLGEARRSHALEGRPHSDIADQCFFGAGGAMIPRAK